MQRHYAKRQKPHKIGKRLSTHSDYSKKSKSIGKRIKCLYRYKKQIMWSGLVVSGISIPMYEAHAQCQLLIQGSEFRINTYTISNQGGPSLASDAEGNFAVVWHSFAQPGGSNFDIYCQRYENNGAVVGGEFRINDGTTGRQFNPVIAMDALGNFTVAFEWENMDNYNSESIYAKRFDQNGAMIGMEFMVNTYTTGNKLNPTIAMNSNGDFIIAWTSESDQDGDQDGVFAQRYNNVGALAGTEFQVNSFTEGNQRRSAVAMNDDGSFVIAWDSNGQDGSGNGVYAQRFDNMGVAVDPEFRVNTYTVGNQDFASIAGDGSGNFIVVWQSFGQDGSGYGIYAQRFNHLGVAVDTEFLVNTLTEGNQAQPKVAMQTNGQFVVTWESGDGSESGVYARRFDPMGVAIDASEFLVNTWTTDFQRIPVINVHDSGDFVIAWESFDQDMGGGFDNGVYAQRFSNLCAGIEIIDPCNCKNEDNIVNNGNIVRFHEILQMNGTGTPGGNVELTANNNPGGFTNSMGTDYPMGEILGMVGMDGTYSIQFEFYRSPGQMVDIEVDGMPFTEAACSLDECISISSITLNDPCDCNNPDNIVENDVIVRFHDVLIISGTGMVGEEIVLTANNNVGGFTDASGMDYPLGEILGQVDMDGNFNIAFEFYREPGAEVDIEVEGFMFTSAACSLSICDDPAAIPTLNQWGALILTLAFSILAILGIRQKTFTLMYNKE
ncbi:MAG TPA: hypothetical protein PKC30_02640 [Saprospiraceae bacterium]|nr:hypothetical protein [Saprospiraceae bacterium]